MNTPAAGAGNWTWRYSTEALRPEIAQELAHLMEMTDRDGYVAPRDSVAGVPA
jgi:4-alpha-glucanotransferase